MDNICRICLKYGCDKNMESLSDNTVVLDKLNVCLPFKLISQEFLPKGICIECKSNVEITFNFHNEIKHNEELLMQLINDNMLSSFYKSLEDTKKIFHTKENLLIFEGVNTIKDIKTCDKVLCENVESIKDVCDSKIQNTDLENVKEIADVSINNDVIKTFNEHDKWECLMCNNIFHERNELRNHYKTQHSKDGDTENIRKYFAINNGKTEKYKCKLCDKEFNSKVRVNRHFVVHVEDRPYFCKICGRTYKEISEILRHGKVHNAVKPLACSHEGCGYTTAYYHALKAHAKRHMDKEHYEFKYTCKACNKGFNVKTSFDQHQNIHTGEKPYVCDVCQKSFHIAKYLKSHRDSMHPECNNKKRHVCIYCGLTCDNRTALNAHLKDHGLVQTFLCDICGKSFIKADHLKLHVKIHLDVKSFACSVCDKAFVKKSNLKLHERVHSGEKPHICSHCGKGFTQRSSLVIHTRNHLGSKPYKCTGCTKSFVCKNQLTRHLKGCS